MHKLVIASISFSLISKCNEQLVQKSKLDTMHPQSRNHNNNNNNAERIKDKRRIIARNREKMDTGETE